MSPFAVPWVNFFHIVSPWTPSDDIFKRFVEKTAGVVAGYQIEEMDDPKAGAVFTVWKDAASRDAYMKSSAIKAEVVGAGAVGEGVGVKDVWTITGGVEVGDFEVELARFRVPVE